MIVKNTKKNPMRFGDTVISPGKTGKLSAPFDESHTLVKRYLADGWLKKTDFDGDSLGETNDETPPMPVESMKRNEIIAELQAAGISLPGNAPIDELREELRRTRS
jgi:hypothetical protein